MSKRSYRRLAVVAGAALALGSMAPAMAASVVSSNAGAAAVSADIIDVAPILGGVRQNLPTTAALGTVSGVQTLATSTAFGAVADAQSVVGGVIGGAQCLVGAGTSAVLNTAAVATAGGTVSVGLGGVGLGLAGGATALLGAPLALVGTAQGCIGQVQTPALNTVSHLQSRATAVAGLATTTAFSGVGSAQSLPGTVLTTASPLFLNDLLSVGLSGGASSSTVAGLGGLINFL